MNALLQKAPLLHDKFFWEGKRLVATSQDVVDKLRRSALSASTAHAMDDCIARWAGERMLPRGEDPWSGASQGTVVHDFNERMFGMLPPLRTRETVEKMLTEEAFKMWPVDPDADPEVITAVLENRARWTEEVRFAYSGLFDIEDPRRVRVLSLEYKIDGIELDGVPAIGYVDRISEVESPDGFGMSIDDYKGLALDTPLPTPGGWTTMGDVSIGDTVLGSGGAPVLVTSKSGIHNRRCFELVFSDGSSIICDNVHLWPVTGTAGAEVLTADDLFARVQAGESFTIPAAGALQLPPAGDAGSFIRGSAEQRSWMLASMTGPATGGRTVFTTTNPSRAKTVFELAASLGFIPVRTAEGDTLTVTFSHAAGQSRSITAMNETASVPTQCIAVDSEDRLYLCGEAMIPTHNTGKKIPNPRYGDHYGDQLRVYTRAIHQITGIKPVQAKLLYTKVPKAVPVDISEKAINKTLKHFKGAWDKHNLYMEEGSFPVKTGPLCGWCPLVNSCPMAKAAGKGPRIEGLPSATDLGIPTHRPGLSPVPVATDGTTIVSLSAADITFFAPDPEEEIVRPEQAETVSAAERAAHITSSGDTPEELSEMEHDMGSITEAKPWDVYANEGQLNPSSYAAGAAFGLTGMAMGNLTKAGIDLRGGVVRALASTYLHIVTEAQREWTGTVSLQEASNTRMRGALHTVLETLPQPWGEDADAWEAWTAKAIKRCVSTTAVALDLFSEPRPTAPWEALAGLSGSVAATPAPVAVVKETVAEAVEAPAPEQAAPAVDPEPTRVRKPAARKPAVKPKPEPKPEPAPEPEEADEFGGVDMGDFDFGE